MAQGTGRRHAIFWSVAAAGAVLDLVSKQLVFGWLSGLEGKSRQIIPGFLALRTDHNTGTFFGLFASSNAVLTVFTVLMMGVVVCMFMVPPREHAGRGRLYDLSLSMVFAGAAGNLYDRAVFGWVRDFLAVGLGPGRFQWPTFNLADAWLTVGIVLYIAAIFLTGEDADAPKKGGGGE